MNDQPNETWTDALDGLERDAGGDEYCGGDCGRGCGYIAARAKAVRDHIAAVQTRAEAAEQRVREVEADARRYQQLRDALLDRMHDRANAVFSAFYDHPAPTDAGDFDKYLDEAIDSAAIAKDAPTPNCTLGGKDEQESGNG